MKENVGVEQSAQPKKPTPSLGNKAIAGHPFKNFSNEEYGSQSLSSSGQDPDESEAWGMLDNGEMAESNYFKNKSIGRYKVIRELGSGSSSTVVLAYDTEKEVRVSIKIIKRLKPGKKDDGSDERVYREVVISSLLNHPNIVRLLEFFYTKTRYFLVFEYVKGMQLYDMVIKKTCIPEKEAQEYFRQIISAVDYIHQNCIVHRDLKIENILIDENNNIKIIDFGLSNFYDNRKLLNTFCGSLYFASPEVLLGQRYFGPEVDIWSLGVVLYVILCGRVPFDDESVVALQEKIKCGVFEFKRPVSPEAKLLVQGMLTVGPGRFGLREICQSSWLNQKYETSIQNYMAIRQPIREINETCVEALESAISFQFPDIKLELLRFVRIFEGSIEKMTEIYDIKNPVVMLYYLLMEGYAEEHKADKLSGRSGILQNPGLEKAGVPGRLHNFVKFIFQKEHEEIYDRYFPKDVFKDSPAQISSTTTTTVWPAIRSSYLKGFFKGIKAGNIGSNNALKKTVLDIFKNYGIEYEAKEHGYYCSYFDSGEECYFKVALYFNRVLSEYYLIPSLLNSKKTLFKSVCEKINLFLNDRVRHIGNRVK